MAAEKIDANRGDLFEAFFAAAVAARFVKRVKIKSQKRLPPITSSDVDKILSEIEAFFNVHHQEGSFPGGIHLELTGLDGLANVNITDIADNEIISYDSSTSKYINSKLVFNNIKAKIAPATISVKKCALTITRLKATIEAKK